MQRYVIIGNGAAGITAAEELRRREARSSVSIVTDERYPMYSRPGLAYVLIDEVPAEQAVARKPEWYARQHIDLIFSRAMRIDFEARQVGLANGQHRRYDALLLAVGARAVPAPFPGGDLDGVVYLDNMDNTLDIIRRAQRARAAVVVGGGITALEMAEGLAHHRVETHYLVRKNNLWSALLNDDESRLVEKQIHHHGVHLHYGSEIAEIVGQAGKVSGVKTTRGEMIACQIVGVAIGVRPNTALAKDTPLKVDRGLLTDEYLQTNLPGVFAAGDCAQIYDAWSGEHRCDSLWPTAAASGRVAAINMTGAKQPYRKGVPFNAALLFGLHLTAIGQVAAAGRDGDDAEELSFISRGSSEVWTAKPGGGYTSAWADDGTSSQRLVVRDNAIVGALLLGNQRLADPLRDLIDQRVSIAGVRSGLLSGGDSLAQAVTDAWARSRTSVLTA
ncbi:MAG TPA: FAD-dependent oxidoreductase [Anaerolineae bacterium]|nr:FAD-dependent oxidoreductase [Anaerolineae bacterium]